VNDSGQLAPHLPADQQPAALTQALAAATAIRDDKDRIPFYADRAGALTMLARHPRPAGAGATSNTKNEDRNIEGNPAKESISVRTNRVCAACRSVEAKH
jgi:hypothetical protein